MSELPSPHPDSAPPDRSAQAAEQSKKVAGWRFEADLIRQVRFVSEVMREKPADLVTRAIYHELARVAESPEFIESLRHETEALRTAAQGDS